MSHGLLERAPTSEVAPVDDGWYMRDNLVYASAPSYFERPLRFDMSTIPLKDVELERIPADEQLDW
jgi:hypothetical protein